MAGNTVHSNSHFCHLLNHHIKLTLVRRSNFRHGFSDNTHITSNLIHIFDCFAHCKLSIPVAEDVLHCVTGCREELFHTTTGNTFDGTTFANVTLFKILRRYYINKLFAHNTIRTNCENCSFRNFNIFTNFCNNCYCIRLHVDIFYSTNFYACVTNYVTGHQTAYLRIINLQFIAITTKSKCTHKSDDAS